MLLIVELIFCFFLLLTTRKGINCYLFLILLHIASYFLQFLVGYYEPVTDSSFRSLFNFAFICLNMFFIYGAWSKNNISSIQFVLSDNTKRYEKILSVICIINIIISIFILVLVVIYIPDISKFKAESQYKELYERLPLFSTVFRYTEVTKNFGLLMFPFLYYYLNIGSYKKALKAFLLSTSTLITGFSFYSRAIILSYFLLLIGSYLLVRKSIDTKITRKIENYIKKGTLLFVLAFLSITIIRFSAMDYYGDRIPEDSIIKNPTLYSLIDYSSQGSRNGLTLLNRYDHENLLYGENLFWVTNLALGFFKITDWNPIDAQERIDKSLGDLSGLFIGYTGSMVINYGYIITLIVSILYYLFVKHRVSKRRILSIMTLSILILLLHIAIVSIFYCDWGAVIILFVFLFFMRFL